MVSSFTRLLLLASCWTLAFTAVARLGSPLPVSAPQVGRPNLLPKGPVRLTSAGQLNSPTPHSAARITASVSREWTATYNGPNFPVNEAVEVAVDGAGNVYVIGTTIDNSNTTNYATVKYTSSGQPE